jgi:hypothetical protein
MTTWIVVRNWDRFQHYGEKRTPPWIKMYTALLHDDDFQSLSAPDRAALVSLWMLYAMTRRRVRVDTAKISRTIGQRVTRRTLERLNQAGFITFSASTPLALDVEVDVEVENPQTPFSEKGTPIVKLIANGVILNEVDLDAELRGYDIDLESDLARSLHDQLRQKVSPTA